MPGNAEALRCKYSRVRHLFQQLHAIAQSKLLQVHNPIPSLFTILPYTGMWQGSRRRAGDRPQRSRRADRVAQRCRAQRGDPTSLKKLVSATSLQVLPQLI